ncbi:hypothetical protein LRS13_12680 [Svornostia abyssi]|uniref:Uncharacterized protein n=1 Tax=Svornostia abyssi TaxID=2898438 RepID=A0ABY5PA40_9ACTN|nr:hypothetical protein LRS13_12680 [Parviterribacteraceae bacterium J379]
MDDPAFARVRDLMDRWFRVYPAEHAADLRGRLSSGDNSQFHSAWFELYLHALHRKLGFDVVVHPTMADVSTRPDFRLVRDGASVLMEATIVGDGRHDGREGRRNRVVAAIERTLSPDFGVALSIKAEDASAPAMRGIRRGLERWLGSLDWTAEREQMTRDPEGLPRRTFATGGWLFEFKAIPRPPHRRDDSQPIVLVGPSDGGSWDHPHDVRARLDEKAKKYGVASNEAVLVALRIDRMGLTDSDLAAALFGPTIGRFDPDRLVVESTGNRGEGFWSCDGLPRNQRIAGVLVYDIELRPWSVTRAAPTLWHRPSAGEDLPVLPWRTATLRDAQIAITEPTAAPADFLDLPDAEQFSSPDQWPGRPFANLRSA